MDAFSFSRNLQWPTEWIFLFLPFGYLWFRVLTNIWFEWTTNPQYSYGLVVPVLCLGLLLRRWQSVPEWIRPPIAHLRFVLTDHMFVVLVFATLAFLYLPTRLVEAAAPEWRPIQWSLGMEAVGLTLCAISLGKGQGWLRQVSFPICFFFAAIPWPTLIETPVIQSLTRVNSTVVVELLGWMGIPALQHGNLIQNSTGTVGIDEACSGIRSFQSSLMISLFFGAFYCLGRWRRLLLVPAGIVLAMVLNVGRMSFLTLVAAKKGIVAIAHYHDPVGIMITLVCTAGLWGLALMFRKEEQSSGQRAEAGDQKFPAPALLSAFRSPISKSLRSGLFRLSLTLLAWLVLVELVTGLWYGSLESHQAPSPKWSVMFPTDNPTFKAMPISVDTEHLLRFDEGRQGAWIDSDGFQWWAFYCSWRPGRVAGYLAKRHTPEICLPAAGRKMVSGPDLSMISIEGVALPMRSYVFGTENGPIYVFHCRWEAGVNDDAYVAHESARFNLIRGIWAGRGKHGQKILEIVTSGYADAGRAKAALVRQLEKLVKVEKTVVSS